MDPAEGVPNGSADTAVANVMTQIHTIDGEDFCRVYGKPSAFLVGAELTIVKDGQLWKMTAFCVCLDM